MTTTTQTHEHTRRINLAKLAPEEQQAIAASFEAFAAAAGEIPEHLWPPAPAPDVPSAGVPA